MHRLPWARGPLGVIAAGLLGAAITSPHQAAGTIAFPLDATLEYCWHPYYVLPCGVSTDVTLHQVPSMVWTAEGFEQGPWSIRPGPQVQLNFNPPYDGTVYRGSPSGGCVVGRMVDTTYHGEGEFRLCPVAP